MTLEELKALPDGMRVVYAGGTEREELGTKNGDFVDWDRSDLGHTAISKLLADPPYFNTWNSVLRRIELASSVPLPTRPVDIPPQWSWQIGPDGTQEICRGDHEKHAGCKWEPWPLPALSVPSPQWTTTPPTEPGWYWHRDRRRRVGDTEFLYVAELGTNGLFTMTGPDEIEYTSEETLRYHGEFCPIPLEIPK